jgi:hypothetical protein
MLKSL